MKDISGYEGLYAITSCGRVWSYKTNKFLKLKKENTGYLQVGISKDGVRKFYGIHRLVAMTYIPNPLGLPQVNHKDEDKHNNCLQNLEWCDAKYNMNYGSRGKDVYCEELERIFKSGSEAATCLGIDASSIGKCCRGERKTAGGYHFKFV